MIVKELVTRLGFNIDEKSIKNYQDRVKGAEKSLQKFAKMQRQTAARIGKTVKTWGVAAGAVTGFVGVVTSAADEINKTAQKIGVGTAELQKLRFAAERSGVPMSALSQAIREQGKRIKEAREGAVGPFSKALDRLGISLGQLEGKTATERLGIFGDALSKVSDESEKTQLAMNLLGEEAGFQLVPLLAEGTDGIAKLGKEAESLGKVISKDTLDSASSFQDSLTNLKTAAMGIVGTLSSELAPALKEVIDTITDWVKENRQLIRQRIRQFIQRVTQVARRLLPILLKIVDGFLRFVNAVSQSTPAVLALVSGIVALKAGLGGLPALFVTIVAGLSSLTTQFLRTFDDLDERLAQLEERNRQLRNEIQNTRDQIGRDLQISETVRKQKTEGFSAAVLQQTARGAVPGAFAIDINDELAKEANRRGLEAIKRARRVGAASGLSGELLDQQAGAAGIAAQEAFRAQRAGRRARAEKVFAETGDIAKARAAALADPGQKSTSRKSKRKGRGSSSATEPELPFGQQNFEQRLTSLLNELEVSESTRLIQAGVGLQEAFTTARAQRAGREAFFRANPNEVLRDRGTNDLLATLSGGRLTSERFGTGSKPGFGAQIVRFDVKNNPTFDTDITIEGGVNLSEGELVRTMEEKVIKVLNRKNTEALRDVLPTVER